VLRFIGDLSALKRWVSLGHCSGNDTRLGRSLCCQIGQIHS
jgi:hypothetical protein